MTALMNAPHVKCCSLITNSPPFVPPPPISAIRGFRNDSVNDVTSAVKAVPMTTATARSMTLPRSRKSLNPLIMGAINPHGAGRQKDVPGASRWGKRHGEGGRARGGREPRRRHVVHGEHEQPAAGLLVGSGRGDDERALRHHLRGRCIGRGGED